jgi:hypothetical protein
MVNCAVADSVANRIPAKIDKLITTSLNEKSLLNKSRIRPGMRENFGLVYSGFS